MKLRVGHLVLVGIVTAAACVGYSYGYGKAMAVFLLVVAGFILGAAAVCGVWKGAVTDAQKALQKAGQTALVKTNPGAPPRMFQPLFIELTADTAVPEEIEMVSGRFLTATDMNQRVAILADGVAKAEFPAGAVDNFLALRTASGERVNLTVVGTFRMRGSGGAPDDLLIAPMPIAPLLGLSPDQLNHWDTKQPFGAAPTKDAPPTDSELRELRRMAGLE